MIKDINHYFEQLESELEACFTIASEARKNGEDPSLSPEILPARDLAERVENLIGIPGLAQRIRQLDKTMSREEAALAIGLGFANNEFGSYESKVQVVEKAVRAAVAMLTEGVVAAPIEGIARVELGMNDDRTDYLQIFYSGPIRSAGGTAQALSVLVADYVQARGRHWPIRAAGRGGRAIRGRDSTLQDARKPAIYALGQRDQNHRDELSHLC